MVWVSSPAKLRPWSELTAQNGDGGGSCVGECQAPKKGINIKNFARNPPPRPPPQGTPDTPKFFMFGASFLFKTQEKAQT